jgi:DNA-binding LytR/AlgR family response regulator
MRVTVSTRPNASGLVVLIVDDEPPGVLELQYKLEQMPQIRRILTAYDAAEALRVLSTDPEVTGRRKAGLPVVDIVFADVTMPGMSGPDFGSALRTQGVMPALIFVSGAGDGAVAAFKLGAADYLLKPAEKDDLERAIDRAIKLRPDPAGATPEAAAEPDDEVIPVELAGTTKLIPRSAVRWVEAQGDYARLHTTDGGSHLVRIPLAQLEERWSDAGFIRIHRSYLVAVGLITEMRMESSGYTVIVGDEKKALPVSRRHTRALKDRLVRAPRSVWGGDG